MKNQPLTGYLIHARPYREKQAIYYLFSQQFGLVHGVGGRGVPLFVQLELFATGQNALKNFSQIHMVSAVPTPKLGQNQYALLYLNELIYKLIALENPCSLLWQAYHDSIRTLQQNSTMFIIKLTLRQFEMTLFDELGVSIEWGMDSRGQAININDFYDFIPAQGFVKSEHGISGELILKIAHSDINNEIFDDTLRILGRIHRHLIDYLLDYEPLNSRSLWAERLKYC